MENTIPNRLRFYSQYLFQHVLAYDDLPNVLLPLTLSEMTLCPQPLDLTHLILKPIELMSDEDAKEFPCWDSRKFNSADEFRKTYELTGFMTSSEAEFLRSKRYAVPFMGLSVDQMVSYGWITLQIKR